MILSAVNHVGVASTRIRLSEIIAAQQVIAGRLHRTPVMRSTFLGEHIGARLYFKLEMFQKTGSFKPCGMLNAMHHLSEAEKRQGVISLSAGNHAQALSYVATQAGIASVIVMPANAVRSKVEATKGYGGEVVLTDADLLQTALALQHERSLALVHPFDHPMTIAGTGTLEIITLNLWYRRAAAWAMKFGTTFAHRARIAQAMELTWCSSGVKCRIQP